MVSAHHSSRTEWTSTCFEACSIVGALPNLLVKLRLLFLAGLEAKQKSGASLRWDYNRIFLSFAKILIVASLTLVALLDCQRLMATENRN